MAPRCPHATAPARLPHDPAGDSLATARRLKRTASLEVLKERFITHLITSAWAFDRSGRGLTQPELSPACSDAGGGFSRRHFFWPTSQIVQTNEAPFANHNA